MKTLLNILSISVFIILILGSVANSRNDIDYCSNQFDSYTYHAIYNANNCWKDAREICKNTHNGCLARPFNRTFLKKIQDSFDLHTVHYPIMYWVGLKYDNVNFVWDNDQSATVTEELMEILNLTEIKDRFMSLKTCTGGNGNGNGPGKCDICMTVTNDTQLKPKRCDEYLKFACQVPENKTTLTTDPPSTTAATTVTTSSTEKKSSTKRPPENKTSTKAIITTDPPSTAVLPLSTKRPTGKKPSSKRPTEKKPSSKRPTEKKPSSTEKKPSTKRPPKKKPTPRPKTATDRKVDDYVQKIKKVKIGDRNSIKSVMNMTSSLLGNLKRDKKAKGNIMKATKEMEDFCIKYAKMYLKPNESKIEKGDNFLIEMRNVSGKQRITFPQKSEQTTVGRTSIDLPSPLFAKDRVVVSALYEGITDYIPSTSDDDDNKEEIISPLISSTLDPKPDDGVFTENVTIVIKHLKKSSKFKPSCVFWDTSVENDLNGTWSSNGCTVKDSNENETVCSCNHLTSFALLMQIDENPSTDEKHKLALSYITYIGCGFSLLGETLTVLAYALLMNVKQEQCQIRVNLAISLAIAQIFYLSGITATYNLGVCTFIAVMIHFFYLVAFGWMMLEGVYLYLMVVKVFNTVIKMRLYYIFAWGFPMIVVGVSLIVASTLKDGIKSYTNQNFCWVSFSNGLVWSFVGPVLLVLLANVIILIRVVREMTRLNRAQVDQADNIRRGVKACVVLFPLLGLTWLFGLLAVTEAGLVFQYIFTILNAFQGFFIFVLHCLRSGELRSSFNRKLQRWELTRSTNFNTTSKSTEHSMSTSDKHPMRNQFVSTDSLQDSLPRNNRVNPANTDDNKSVRTCATPIDGPDTCI